MRVKLRGSIDSDYIHYSLHPQIRRDKVTAAIRHLRNIEFDAIAVRGMSGAIIGGAIATTMNKPIILVRKDKYNDETHHSCMSVEGPLNWNPPARYVIVDDFASTGNTLRVIQDKIGSKAECIGVYLYRDEEFTKRADFSNRWLPEDQQKVEPLIEPMADSIVLQPLWAELGQMFFERWRGQRLGVLFTDDLGYAGDYYTTAPASLAPPATVEGKTL